MSLKNESVAVVAAALPGARWGPWLRDTPKGDIRHLMPDARALAGMDTPATPALLLFPRFGAPLATRPLLPTEAFVRLTEASTNYVSLGEAGFRALTNFVQQVPAIAVDYPESALGVKAVEDLWATR